MPSPLDFGSTELFRKKLFTRNLRPYKLAPYVDPNQIAYPTLLSDESVVDTKPDIEEQSQDAAYKFPRFNVYSPDTPFFYSTGTLIKKPEFEPYPNFDSSFYQPIDILFNPDPLGSNGLLSSDSFIAKFGAVQLKKLFEERIAVEIYQKTTARANLFGANSGSNLFGVLTNRIPLIEPNYQITVPANPLLAAVDLAIRLSGTYVPFSPIPGSYFDTSIVLGQPTTIQQIENAFNFKPQGGVGKFFARLLGATQTGSEKFLANTGPGQKSVLFKNIDMNRFKPDYDRTFLDRLGGAVVGGRANSSNYYVGSKTMEPSMVFSPVGDLPTDNFGRAVQAPVYGPSELAKLYEGVEKAPVIGPAGVPYVDGGGIEGGLTWVSPKYKLNAGKYVAPGGKEEGQDPDFKPSTYNNTQSTNFKFRSGSILEDTQKLVDSQPQGKKKFEHVGNAIDQVSKVFNDGYKEMTKGSRVISYVGPIGNEVGAEYCRVFTKDTPFLQYNDLQKTDGMTTEGRKFSYSVLDKTYNLNIVPNRRNGGQDSSNLIGNANGAYAKKYMFSIENLAWRTSKMFEDLADCEKGPNGGRVMWFPPYGLTFNENVNTSWQTSEFLGRPEPVYTYKSTSRSGSLSWKIVVDHPSVLNLIVNKVLKDQTNKAKIDSIINSFFAGCRKYDLYELAKKYAFVSRTDLYEMQRVLTSPDATPEDVRSINAQVNPGLPSPAGKLNPAPEAPKKTDPDFNYAIGLGFYFDNDIPTANDVDYKITYDAYLKRKEVYQTNAYGPNKKPDKTAKEQVTNMFSLGVEGNFAQLQIGSGKFYQDILALLKEDRTVTVELIGGASAPASENYNLALGKRRTSSVETYYKNSELGKYIGTKLVFKASSVGETGLLQVKGLNTGTINCKTKGKDVGDFDIFSRNAMACRTVQIKSVTASPPPTNPQPAQNNEQTFPPGNVPGTFTPPIQQATPASQGPAVTEVSVLRDNITKRLLRKLLSECDYFEVIKEETPMVYDNLKDKLQFFDPAFHSMTPEGLNTRLTFLQQCMRPGESIPTIKEVNGQTTLQYDQALNTSFGAPPILILRVGDFYNTKITPTSLAITYENLDINPEGIGVQPMIANVSLGFNFIGGEGLKEPIDKLQNALTFNYYANTEIYDDRADATDIESAKALDADFLQSVQFNDTTNNLDTVNDPAGYAGKGNSETIGTVTKRAIVDELDEGDINYKEIMNVLLDQSQVYFNNIINKTKTIIDQYGSVMMQQIGYQRYYTKGSIKSQNNTDENNLYGKPQNIETRLNRFFTDYSTSVDAKENSFIFYLEKDQFNFSNKLIRVVKKNFVKYIDDSKGSFYNAVTTTIQELTNQQQNFGATLNRLNVLFLGDSTTLIDGYALENGNVKVYRSSATTEVDASSNLPGGNTKQEIQKDTNLVADAMKNFMTEIQKQQSFPNNLKGVMVQNGEGKDKNFIFDPFTNPTDPIDGGSFWDNKFGKNNKIGYMILNNIILDDKKYEDFKSKIINDVVNNAELKGDGSQEISRVFDDYWKVKIRPLYKAETQAAKTFVEKMEKEKLQNFIKFTPYTKNKPRKFTFKQISGPSSEEKKAITDLGKKVNSNTSSAVWNNKVKFN